MRVGEGAALSRGTAERGVARTGGAGVEVAVLLRQSAVKKVAADDGGRRTRDDVAAQVVGGNAAEIGTDDVVGGADQLERTPR